MILQGPYTPRKERWKSYRMLLRVSVGVYVRTCMVFCVKVHSDFRKDVLLCSCYHGILPCLCVCLFLKGSVKRLVLKWTYSLAMKKLSWSIVSLSSIRVHRKEIGVGKVKIFLILLLRKEKCFLGTVWREDKTFMRKEKWWVLAMVILSLAHVRCWYFCEISG